MPIAILSHLKRALLSMLFMGLISCVTQDSAEVRDTRSLAYEFSAFGLDPAAGEILAQEIESSVLGLPGIRGVSTQVQSNVIVAFLEVDSEAGPELESQIEQRFRTRITQYSFMQR